MKFSKFVKSLAPDGGAIYEYMDERWLASPSVLMLIPDGIRSVTGYSNEKMPDGIGQGSRRPERHHGTDFGS